ncbi:GLPGLI family protein [Chryseobacterium tongliaoense]|uniref:GLPGLI family protein n=1 Tax=Chryseobacterium tongliaoense TaxID=3240933 RepID=UPI0035150D88
MKFYPLILTFFLSFYNGQSIISPNFSIKTAPFEVINYEKSSYNIYYKVNFLDNALSLNSQREVLCILEIGDKVSKFFDHNHMKIDSLDEKYSSQNTIGAKETGLYLKTKVLWHNVIFRNNDSITVQDRFRKVYQYEESQPKLNWSLEKEDKDILGYKCNKATVKYRGRDYVAWYTNDISVSNGPYIFNGLPGLIMEVEDSDRKYHFVAVGIDKNPRKIYLRNEKSILRTTREKFRNVQKTYRENPGAFYSGKAYNEDGTPIIIKQQNVKYESMEIE